MKLFKTTILATVSLAAITFGAHNASAAAAGTPPMHMARHTPASADWMSRMNPDMRQVIMALTHMHGKPIETLSADEARKQPSAADAVKAVLKQQGRDPDDVKQQAMVDTRDTQYMGVHGDQAARIYTPKHNGSGPLPVIVYYHGGGWVLADLDTYDAGPRALAHKTGAIVFSAEYRHAPEYKFPAAHEDAFAAYEWVLHHAKQFGGDPMKVAVAGESAGGNLAANVAIMARDQHIQPPVHMLLVYPVAGADMNTPSYIRNAQAKPLNKAMMEWFVAQTLESPEQAHDPRIDLVHANLNGLPSATVITAGIDPLMSEGQMLADKLNAAGNQVDSQNFAGVTHEFFGMDAVVADAGKAQNIAAQDLKDAFMNNMNPHHHQAMRHTSEMDYKTND